MKSRVIKVNFKAFFLICALYGNCACAQVEKNELTERGGRLENHVVINSIFQNGVQFNSDQLLEKIETILTIPEGRVTKVQAEKILEIKFANGMPAALAKDESNSDLVSYGASSDDWSYSFSGEERGAKSAILIISLQKNTKTPVSLCIDREKIMLVLQKTEWRTKGMTSGIHGDLSNSYWFTKGVSGSARVDFGSGKEDFSGEAKCLLRLIVSNKRP